MTSVEPEPTGPQSQPTTLHMCNLANVAYGYCKTLNESKPDAPEEALDDLERQLGDGHAVEQDKAGSVDQFIAQIIEEAAEGTNGKIVGRKRRRVECPVGALRCGGEQDTDVCLR